MTFEEWKINYNVPKSSVYLMGNAVMVRVLEAQKARYDQLFSLSDYKAEKASVGNIVWLSKNKLAP